ncbi:Uncharacterised protein [Burkholderia pseudomallei]|nr:Uncharacterised protein [Burkholderia pseudomallei]CAJ8834392.1 Uncharacterised protein [Burkholderia pseudomallei]
MYAYWSCRSSATDGERPSAASSAERRTIAKPMPGTPSRHLPLAEISASMPLAASAIGSAPNELIASTISALPRARQTAAMSSSGFSRPALVSRCTSATCVRRASRASAASIACALAGSSSANGSSTCATPSRRRIAAIRAQYAPLFGTSTRASRGTSVPSVASTANVPLPCSGTHTYASPPPAIRTRSAQTLFVSRLKAASHEPQSRSIASRVMREVVSGPGVNRMGSRSGMASSLRKRSGTVVDGCGG